MHSLSPHVVLASDPLYPNVVPHATAPPLVIDTYHVSSDRVLCLRAPLLVYRAEVKGPIPHVTHCEFWLEAQVLVPSTGWLSSSYAPFPLPSVTIATHKRKSNL